MRNIKALKLNKKRAESGRAARGGGGEWERAESEHESERETGMKKSLD